MNSPHMRIEAVKADDHKENCQDVKMTRWWLVQNVCSDFILDQKEKKERT